MGKPVHVLKRLDADARTATCAHCGPVAVVSGGAGSTQWRCIYSRRSHRGGKRYRTTINYAEQYDQQLGRCAICNTWQPALQIDHDHSTGIARGLLCGRCNRLLGMARDNTTTLRTAALYLEQYATERRD